MGSDHPLVHKVWQVLLDAKFTFSQVREISQIIGHDFSLSKIAALQEFGGNNVSESAAIHELWKGQQLLC